MHAIHERDKVIAQALGQAFKAAAEPKIAKPIWHANGTEDRKQGVKARRPGRPHGL